jgi:hypothetical protein
MSATHLEHDIRTHLAGYLAGEMSLRQLEDWLVPSTWDEHHNPESEQLSSRILLHISEHDDGWLSEDDLKALLRPLAVLPISATHDKSISR